MNSIPEHTSTTYAAFDVGRARIPFGYPTNSLVSVFDSPSALLALRATLLDQGVAPERIETLRGVASRQRLEAPPAGLLGAARRWLGWLGPEAELFQGYARELRAGHALLVLHGVRRGSAEELRDVLTAHGGHAVQHFGRLTVTLLAP